MDNGVADLLGQMVKINKALGIMEVSDDEASNLSPAPVLSKSNEKLSQDRSSIRDSYSGNLSQVKLAKEKAENPRIRESQSQLKDSMSASNQQTGNLSNLQKVLLSQNQEKKKSVLMLMQKQFKEVIAIEERSQSN